MFNKFISSLVFGGCRSGAPISYSRKHLPPLATVASPQGHRLHGRLHFAAGHVAKVKGQHSVSGYGGRTGAREGDTVLTLCLGTLNNVISDSVRLWANQSFCYWTSSGDYSSWTFDIGWRQTDPA